MNYVYIKSAGNKLNLCKFLKNKLVIGLKEAKDMMDSNLPQSWREGSIQPIAVYTSRTVKAAKDFIAELKAECPDVEVELLKEEKKPIEMPKQENPYATY